MVSNKILKISLLAGFPAITTSLNLNITAIGASFGHSTLECWQLTEPFSQSNTSGTAGSANAFLSGTANISFTVIPSDFDGGLHNAPRNQWVYFTTGLAIITLPQDNSSIAYITGGEFGLIFAADTADISKEGHRTQYPGTTETIAIQVPTEGNIVPAHIILYDGPCKAAEVSGLKGLATAG